MTHILYYITGMLCESQIIWNCNFLRKDNFETCREIYRFSFRVTRTRIHLKYGNRVTDTLYNNIILHSILYNNIILYIII